MIAGLSILSLLIFVIVVAAGVAIVYVALNRFGIKIPDWVVHIFCILIVAFVSILALKLLWSIV